jgi:hypothetical protein
VLYAGFGCRSSRVVRHAWYWGSALAWALIGVELSGGHTCSGMPWERRDTRRKRPRGHFALASTVRRVLLHTFLTKPRARKGIMRQVEAASAGRGSKRRGQTYPRWSCANWPQLAAERADPAHRWAAAVQGSRAQIKADTRR